MKACQAGERLFYLKRYMEKVWKELREGRCHQMWMRNTATSQGKCAKQTEESHGDPSHIQTTLPLFTFDSGATRRHSAVC